jgi:hypothetical protein
MFVCVGWCVGEPGSVNDDDDDNNIFYCIVLKAAQSRFHRQPPLRTAFSLA